MWLGHARGGRRPVRLAAGRADHVARRACSPPTSPRWPSGSRRPRWAQVEPGGSDGIGRWSRRVRGARRRRWPWPRDRAPAGGPLGPGARGARRTVLLVARRRSPRARSLVALAGGRSASERGRDPGCGVRVLDVGQGDAILLDPPAGDADPRRRRPAGRGSREPLAELGVDSLAAVVVTHPDADHAGGLADVLAQSRVGPAALRACRPRDARLAAAAGTRSRRIAAGTGLRDGGLRLDGAVAARAVRSRRPRRGAERRLARAPRPLARLSHAAHGRRRGRAGAGSPGRRRRAQGRPPRQRGRRPRGPCSSEARPELALISVGADNPYGHPAPATLGALAEAGVPVMRTDEDGELMISAGAGGRCVGDRGAG